MKSSVKKLKDCKVKIFIEVEPERVEGRFQDILKEFQKAARIPGFRDGKAPLDMVEKKYAEEAREEVLKSLIPEAYHQSVVTQKVMPATLPSISEIQYERGKKLTFTAEFEKAPEFSLKAYKGLKLKREDAAVTQEDLDKSLASFLESRAELIPLAETRAVQKGDFIVTDIEIWKDGKFIPGKKDVLLFVESNKEDDFFEKIVGAAVGEVREIHSDPTEEEKKQGIVGRKPHYNVTVRGIREKKVPVLTDEFAKTMGKPTAEELKDAIRKELAGYKQSESLKKMRSELFEKLLELGSFTVPEGLVEKQKEKLLEDSQKQFLRMGVPQKFEEEKVNLEKDAEKRAEEQVRLYFILQKISELEGIDVDEIELEKRLQGLVKESGRPMDEVRRTFEDDLREGMRESKTVEFLIANAKFDEKV